MCKQPLSGVKCYQMPCGCKVVICHSQQYYENRLNNIVHNLLLDYSINTVCVYQIKNFIFCEKLCAMSNAG